MPGWANNFSSPRATTRNIVGAPARIVVGSEFCGRRRFYLGKHRDLCRRRRGVEIFGRNISYRLNWLNLRVNLQPIEINCGSNFETKLLRELYLLICF